MAVNRRTFIGGSGAALGTLVLGAPAVLGQAKARVVVIGGGAGGATAAKYIARDAKGAIEVTLVEPAKQFVTCFHSNLYLGGYKSMSRYHSLLRQARQRLRHQARAAEPRPRSIATRSRSSSPMAPCSPTTGWCVSPGIDLKYDSVPGWGQEHEEAHAARLEGRQADRDPARPSSMRCRMAD